MKLHEVFNMSEEDILDYFVCLAIEKQLEYVYDRGNYLWIKGNIPVCLTSHVDVFDEDLTLKTIQEYRGMITAIRNGKRAMLGADDRAGVHIIDKLFRDFTPHIMLFAGEEWGGTGVDAFINNKPNLSDIKLFISCDSPGTNEFIYYGTQDNRVLEYFKSYGFRDMGKGIFTDIMVIGEYVDTPCINVSVGYERQHTDREYLDVTSMELTYSKLHKILQEISDCKCEIINIFTNPNKIENWYGEKYVSCDCALDF